MPLWHVPSVIEQKIDHFCLHKAFCLRYVVCIRQGDRQIDLTSASCWLSIYKNIYYLFKYCFLSLNPHDPHGGQQYILLESAHMHQTDFVATVFDGRSNPNKVTVAFTMAVNALRKGHSATLILMVEAVELGKPGAVAGMDIGQPFEPVEQLLAQYLALGGRVAICGSCMIHNGLKAEDMDSRYAIITASDVIDLLMGARGSLQIT